MTIDVADLEERQIFGPWEWMHPREFSGYSIEDEANLNHWLSTAPYEEVSKFCDESDQWPPVAQKITNYLVKCIEVRKSLIENGDPVPPGLFFSIDDVIDAALFMITVLESHYPATFMGSLHFLVTQETSKNILQRFRKAFESESRPLVRESLRDFMVELYLYDLYFEPKDSPLAKYLDTHDLDFLRSLCKANWWEIRT